MSIPVINGPGLTVTRFLQLLSDEDVRRFLDPTVLSVLDAIFGGAVAGEDLRRVAHTIVSFDVLLGTPEGRKLVLSVMPSQKREELEARVGRSIRADGAGDWSDTQVQALRDFFGFAEERFIPTVTPATTTASPALG